MSPAIINQLPRNKRKTEENQSAHYAPHQRHEHETDPFVPFSTRFFTFSTFPFLFFTSDE